LFIIYYSTFLLSRVCIRDQIVFYAQFEFKEHVVFWLQADAGSEDVLEHGSLFAECIDTGCAFRDQGRLCELTEQHGDGVHILEDTILVIPFLYFDTGAQFSDNGQV